MAISCTRRDEARESLDYYATPPRAVKELLKLEAFSRDIWEPCCGGGHISKELIAQGYHVFSTDIADHGYGIPGIDFLAERDLVDTDIITNPPYTQAQAFVEHALKMVTRGHKVAMFLRLVFLETQARKELFQKFPPIRVHVSSVRLGCAKNGEFKCRPDGELYYPSSVAYAWFIWEAGYKGPTIIDWF